MLRIFTGAHTVGVAEWQFFVDRLYNFLGTGLPDPNLDPTYGNYLRNICPEANWSLRPNSESQRVAGLQVTV